ncbi:MAG: RNA polymerase sigma factor RpoD/SigA [Chloroflexota bacterium]
MLPSSEEPAVLPGGTAATEERRSDQPVSDLAIYLDELRSSPLLTADQEIALAQEVEAGREARNALTTAVDRLTRDELEEAVRIGEAAFDKLVESNLRLVVAVARRYVGRGVDLEDLIQDGNLGLYRAAGRYDWRRGTRFSTYAMWWIRQAIHRSLANSSRLIRLPVYVGEQLARARYAVHRLEQELGRASTPTEQRDHLDPAAQRVMARAAALERPVSIDGPVTEDLTLAEILPDESVDDALEIVEHRLTASGLDDALTEMLQPREAAVLRLRYGLGGCRESSLVDVGTALGVTRERARQIEDAALRKLRRSARIQCQFGANVS